MTKALPILLIGTLAGCTGTITSGTGGGGNAGANDHTPPTVEMTSPERGTVTGDGTVTVSGRATDTESDIAQVTINGTQATLAGDGSFTATLDTVPGITLIDTVATDAAGNTAHDARAVLTGTLVDQTTPVSAGLAANISAEAMTGLSSMVSDLANNTDFGAIARSQNPVANTGGTSCNSANVYVDSISQGGTNVNAGPTQGGIDTGVTMRNLVVRGHVNFRAVCIGGSDSYTITADAFDLGGMIAPGISGGDITIALNGVTADFRGFNLSAGGVPGFITDLIKSKVRDKLTQILRDKISQMVPPLANSFLAQFLADSYSVSVFGQNLNIAVEPSGMTWTDQGGTIVLDTSATVDGVDGMYLSTPSSLPSEADMASNGLRIAVADDVLNQLLAGIWSSGALENAILPNQGDALSAAFGGEVSSATVTIMLPPVASFDTTTGTAQITLGDVMVEAMGQGGESLAKFVMSAQIELAAETSANGTVKLITQTPTILAQVLSQSDTLLAPLTDQKVSAIAELAIKQIALQADGVLEDIPVPGLAGATVMSPTFAPAQGYLLMGGQIQFQ